MLDRRGKDLPRFIEVTAGIEHALNLGPSVIVTTLDLVVFLFEAPHGRHRWVQSEK
jgi:hypothetical protein